MAPKRSGQAEPNSSGNEKLDCSKLLCMWRTKANMLLRGELGGKRAWAEA